MDSEIERFKYLAVSDCYSTGITIALIAIIQNEKDNLDLQEIGESEFKLTTFLDKVKKQIIIDYPVIAHYFNSFFKLCSFKHNERIFFFEAANIISIMKICSYRLRRSNYFNFFKK